MYNSNWYRILTHEFSFRISCEMLVSTYGFICCITQKNTVQSRMMQQLNSLTLRTFSIICIKIQHITFWGHSCSLSSRFVLQNKMLLLATGEGPGGSEDTRSLSHSLPMRKGLCGSVWLYG